MPMRGDVGVRPRFALKGDSLVHTSRALAPSAEIKVGPSLHEHDAKRRARDLTQTRRGLRPLLSVPRARATGLAKVEDIDINGPAGSLRARYYEEEDAGSRR